jgi:hypothetical protein
MATSAGLAQSHSPTPLQCLSHADAASITVDIGPLKAEGFTASQSGSAEKCPKRI